MPGKRKSKYKKTHIELWKCVGCQFEWAYKTLRCPMCSGIERRKIM